MWSIVMQPGKKYSTVVERTFHLSMAVLDLDSVKKGDDIHTVYVETNDKQRTILCHLSKASKIYQCKLDHVFEKGTNLQFVTKASANVHMTGYIDYKEYDSEFYSDLESITTEEEDTPVSNKTEKGIKRKSDSIPRKSKSLKLEEISDDESLDFDDDSDEEEGVKLSDLLDEEADEEDDEEDTDDDDIEEEEDDDSIEEEEEDDDDDDKDEESEDHPVLTKKDKNEYQTPKKQINGNKQKTPKNEQKTPKNEQKTPKNNEKTPISPKTQKQKSSANKSLVNGSNEESNKVNKEHKTPLGALKTKPDTPIPKDKQNQQQKLNGGVIIHDLKIGDGAVAKPGKNVKVYYIGRLKSTGKVFDSMQKGSGFSFGLQRGEVIKGWDIGIAGMKVGGKRKVVCPPSMAYGAKGSPPEIPPNSTLVFEVELKHVN